MGELKIPDLAIKRDAAGFKLAKLGSLQYKLFAVYPVLDFL